MQVTGCLLDSGGAVGLDLHLDKLKGGEEPLEEAELAMSPNLREGAEDCADQGRKPREFMSDTHLPGVGGKESWHPMHDGGI